MEVKSVTIPYKFSEPIKIHLLGDIHAGIKHCSESQILDRVKEIKNDPNAYFIGMGDYADFITPSDPRWDIQVIADWVEKDNLARSLEKHVINLFSPIKDKCLGLLEGNHEDAIRIHNHDDVQKNICNELSVSNLGYTVIIIFTLKRRKSTESHHLKGVFTHGSGWAVTKGSKINRLERFMNMFPTCRIAAMGHMHDRIDHTLPYLDINTEGKIVDAQRVGVVSGSWLRTYAQGVRASYAEKKGYPPTTLGSPVIMIKPNENRIWVE